MTRRLAATEGDEQRAIFDWARIAEKADHRIGLLFHIANGGKRNMSVARRLKSEGVKPGVPDLCLPVPNAGFYGLWIEMKTKSGRATSEQKAWMVILQEQGYFVCLCRGAESAISVIQQYLSLQEHR